MAIEQVKRFAARLRERAAPPLRVVFELPSEDELLRSLDPLASAQMRGAQAAWSAGDRERAIELVVAHFRERDNAPFFLSGHDLREAVARLRRERPEWVSATLAQADRMAGGDFDVYAQTARLLTAEDWAFAPLGPGRDLLHRQRPHRFAFAPRLALAALYGHETACGTLERSVGAWAESCEPVGRFSRRSRPFRASSHVSVYRAVAVSWALAFLAASSRSSVELEFLLLRTILADALSIARSIRRTTRNNHLVADGFGLWYLGSVYPEFRDAARWRSTGLPVFRDELLRQTFPDGTSFEHSVHYQEHTCEMGMAFLALCRAHDWASDAELAGRIRAMMHFQAMLAGRDGSAVAIGDSTEDPLFPLDNDDAWCGPGIRALYSEWFGDALPVDPAVASLQRAFWLGGGRMTGARTGPDPDDRRRLHRFDDSGFALMAANRGRDRLIFRTGPPERQEIVCGHMHFDFLGVHVVIDGNMVVVPSGTYTYRANPNSWPMPYPGWREHFMSARASNGLVLSQGDPLERGPGDFPGGVDGDIACRVRTSPPWVGDSVICVDARITGRGGYAGWARTVFCVRDEYWLVVDRLPAWALDGSASLGLQCAAGAVVTYADERQLDIDLMSARLGVSFSAGLGRPRCLTGSMQPRGGWVSTRYGRMQPAPQLLFPVGTGVASTAFVLSNRDAPGGPAKLETFCATGSGIRAGLAVGETIDRLDMTAADDSHPANLHWQRSADDRVLAEESL